MCGTYIITDVARPSLCYHGIDVFQGTLETYDTFGTIEEKVLIFIIAKCSIASSKLQGPQYISESRLLSVWVSSGSSKNMQVD